MCFYMASEKCFEVKDYAIVQLSEMAGPPPAPHQK